MEEAEIEVSLEELVYLLKNPPLIERISSEKKILTKSERKKFSMIKKGYKESLERVVRAEKKKLPLVFRDFLKRYESYFKGNYDLLESLDNESIGYVIGHLEFEKNVQKNRYYIPIETSNITQ